MLIGVLGEELGATGLQAFFNHNVDYPDSQR